MSQFGRVAAYLSCPYWCVYSLQCTVESEIVIGVCTVQSEIVIDVCTVQSEIVIGVCTVHSGE
jgi:hypothetical protein